jgi:DNA polymerase-3 subunit gamma/tau
MGAFFIFLDLKVIKMYTALYRKWRPKNFNDVIGQEHITKTLKNEIKGDKVGHAYLFCGTRGTGKTSTAKIFARAVNCEDLQEGEPCNKCRVCLDSLKEANLDILEIDAASNTGVDNIRELIDNIKYTPSESRFKVYIIDEVHMLSINAFNALLKTLEEPPAHAIFILATTDIQKVPPTILSRCQRFDFKRISSKQMSIHIKEILKASNITAQNEAVELVCRLSDGAMRDALSILDQCISYAGENIKYDDVVKVLGIASDEYLYKITNCIEQASQDKAESVSKLLELLNELIQNGKDINALLNEMLQHFRNLMVMKVSSEPKEIIETSEEKLATLKKSAENINLNKIMYLIDTLGEAIQEMKWIMHKRLYAEMTFIKLCEFEDNMSKENLAKRVDLLETQLKSAIDALKNGTIQVDNSSSNKANIQGLNQNSNANDNQNVNNNINTNSNKTANAGEHKANKIVINNAIDFCLKNWTKILEELREKKSIPLSTWVILDEAKVVGNGNMLNIVTGDVVSELSLKREVNNVINYLNSEYNIKINIMVKVEKTQVEKNGDIEYIIEKTKEKFGDIDIEIVNE